MTPQPIPCPQCDAPLELANGQRFYRCPYCGSKFVVNRVNPRTPRLEAFPTALAAKRDALSVAAADERLAEMEAAVADADDEVEAKRDQLMRANLSYRDVIERAYRMLEPPQNATLVAALLATICWFLVAFSLEGLLWYLGLAMAILLVLLSATLRRRWERTERKARNQLRDARQSVQEAEAVYNSSVARREERLLEQEFRQLQAQRGPDPTT